MSLCPLCVRRETAHFQQFSLTWRFPFDGLWASDQASSREHKGIALNSCVYPHVRPKLTMDSLQFPAIRAEDGVPPVMLRERLGDLSQGEQRRSLWKGRLPVVTDED